MFKSTARKRIVGGKGLGLHHSLQAIEMRRGKLGLTRETPAMLVADGFTGNFATRQNEDSRRAKWSADNNCVLPIRPPGGWSACGQPCDAYHHHFRKLANHYIDGVLGNVDQFQSLHMNNNFVFFSTNTI